MSKIQVTIYKGRKVPAFAKGGLADAAREVARAGRNGDDRIIHVNQQEFDLLRKQWGEPTVNPKTGLPEYFGFADVLGLVAPIAAGAVGANFTPDFLTDALGQTGGSALTGGALGALASGVMGKGAIKGGLLGAGAGALGANWSDISSSLGNLIKGGSGAESLSSTGPDATSALAPGRGMPDASSEMYDGDPLGPTSKMPSADAEISGAIAKDAMNSNNIPMSSTAPRDPAPTGFDLAKRGASAGNSGSGDGLSRFWEKNKIPIGLGGALMALQYMNRKPQQAASAPNVVNNAPLEKLSMSRTANPALRSMPTRDWYTFGTRAHPTTPGNGTFFNNVNGFTPAAHGGLMTLRDGGAPVDAPIAHEGPGYVGTKEPGGDGRSDGVPAMLSNKEYVVDAETTALLGDGDPDAGARKLDQMRADIRKHKGAALSKGKFSPKAKPALAYLRSK